MWCVCGVTVWHISVYVICLLLVQFVYGTNMTYGLYESCMWCMCCVWSMFAVCSVFSLCVTCDICVVYGVVLVYVCTCGLYVVFDV